jgi:hypothetical protein
MGEKWGALDSSIFFSSMVETREEQRIVLEIPVQFDKEN